MRKHPRYLCTGLLLVATAMAAQAAFAQSAFHSAKPRSMKALEQATPYQNNDGQVPSRNEYKGPLFQLSHDWPTKPLPPLQHAPWQEAIHNQQITVANAAAYAAALKNAVAKNAIQLIEHYDQWNAAKAGWYNEPWLGSIRESIRGTYAAGQFGPAIFPGTGLRTTFGTHVLTYYDQRAAFSLYNFWGASSMHPNLKTENAQFQQGSIIVKAAVFASTDPTKKLGWWDAMHGAQVWNMYLPVGKSSKPRVWPGYVAQFDIIVKDSQSSPKTGWVFMTLVYDRNAPGNTVWDKMVPLGVQWGNDPQATRAGMPLTENWINPAAPKYSTQTLGWGGRLSGPNDGGRNNIAVNGKAIDNAPNSGCMSCHSTSQWNISKGRMVSFLLPSFPTDTPHYFKQCNSQGKVVPKGSYICSPAPGTSSWMKWFQDRPGNVAMDEGSFATDYDEVFSFKSLPLWCKATQPQCKSMKLMLVNPANAMRFNQYTGAPLPKREDK
jgi:hypothetical protein